MIVLNLQWLCFTYSTMTWLTYCGYDYLTVNVIELPWQCLTNNDCDWLTVIVNNRICLWLANCDFAWLFYCALLPMIVLYLQWLHFTSNDCALFLITVLYCTYIDYALLTVPWLDWLTIIVLDFLWFWLKLTFLLCPPRAGKLCPSCICFLRPAPNRNLGQSLLCWKRLKR